MLVHRARVLLPSATLAVDALAKQLEEKGKPVINLTLGEPDFATPANIGKAAYKAIKEGFTHYTATAGILPLRNAIAEKLKKDNNVSYEPSEIIVGVGTKQILYNAFQVLIDEGMEVIIPTPTWSTYVEQVKLALGKPVLVPLKPPFKLKAQDIEPYINKKTKVIILNSPSNPTSAVIEKEELVKIARLAIEKNIYIVSDEIYEKLIYEGTNYSIASLGNEIKDLTITINGFSKSYAMTGWRIGYGAGPKEIIKAMTSFQGQTTSNTSSIAQMAAIEALYATQQPLKKMKQEFERRREYLIKEFSSIRGITFTLPEGAFYFFVNIKKLLKKGETSSKWCERLLAKKYVAVVPGEAFCAQGYFRLSYAASMKNLKEGIRRIREYI
ncbi:hypothetical protein A3F59_05715 [Candidatus Roizmanbacteria bacterium RIFCSPHIGHO2_12_FULL_38_13]|nr:MAG: hypothetical protein A3F59_05715 [Candidatus Roizmanbacteria bacterium RIFCSPHIGHO2_12_FULL_38_13]